MAHTKPRTLRTKGICQIKTHDYKPDAGINILTHCKYKNILFDTKRKEINNENVILAIHDDYGLSTIAYKSKIIEFLPNFKNMKELFLVDGDRYLLLDLVRKMMVNNNNTPYDINIITNYEKLGFIHEKIGKGTFIDKDNFYDSILKHSQFLCGYKIVDYINDNYFEESIDITKG